MALKLYLHPLSSYCHKVLIALYENDIAFEPVLVERTNFDEFRRLWPIGKFPVLQDEPRGELVPESSIIIEYLAVNHPGPVQLIPQDRELAWRVRLQDRFMDNYLHAPMQRFAAERLRPADPVGLEQARATYLTALSLLDSRMARQRWAVGDEFTMADCAAAPALFYGERFYGPFGESHPNAMAYLERLLARPSYARALREAQPYMHLLPK